MDIFCQRTGFLPSGKHLCESFVVRHPGAGCTLRSRAQRRLLPARVQAAAPGGGDSNGEKRRRKPWRKKSKDSAAGKEKKAVAASTQEQQQKQNGEGSVKSEVRPSAEQGAGGEDGADGSFVDDFNPVVLGRKSRQMLNNVWRQFTKLGSPVTSSRFLENEFSGSVIEVGEFETPQAANTTVLVTGATGRVGRVLVRKLVLRGYKVVVLARDREEVAQSLPSSVRIVQGDIGDVQACRTAIQDADKVVYCARARTSSIEDVKLVEEEGVVRLAVELQDARQRRAAKQNGRNPTGKLRLAEAANFKADWAVERRDEGGLADDDDSSFSSSLLKSKRSKFTKMVRDEINTSVNSRNNLIFEGTVNTKGGSAQVGTPLNVGASLSDCEGIYLRACGDGQPYIVQLTQEGGETYTARINTHLRFMNFRLPFNAFRYNSGGDAPAPLDPSKITRLSVRFENKKTMPPVMKPGNEFLPIFSDSFAKSFRLEIDRIKALPGGEETDFILVSCAGAGVADDESGNSSAAALSHKRRGETALRLSGLGYTIVRPGPLLEEPGGYKALVFDQGERISQGISCADVADVCLKALHDAAARNKTFEVCHEYTPERGLEQYELVAHLPDKANNYLGPALAVLEKNT
ncbi:g9470 [Coccomyxa elongata]